MSEILASIRRTMADDHPPAPGAEAEEDVLELTDPLPDDETPVMAIKPAEAGRLVSQASAAASTAAFATLAGAVPRRTPTPLPLGNGARTIEDLVKEVLQPILQSWVDANLPLIVERQVREEIERLARDAR